MTPDDIPYIGEYARSLSNFYVATGFNKWGMTSAMAAAQILTDKIIGRENPNAAVFSPIGRKFKAQILVNAFTSVGNLLCPCRTAARIWAVRCVTTKPSTAGTALATARGFRKKEKFWTVRRTVRCKSPSHKFCFHKAYTCCAGG